MNGSLRLNVVAGAFGMFWLCAPLGAPLPLLMQAVDASATQLGLLSAAWQLAMLAQIPASLVAETMDRRKPFWATTCIVHRILWATPALLPWLFPASPKLWPVVLIAALGLSNVLANAGTASWQSWMADLVPPESAGRFWSVRQLVLSFGLVGATALYGWMLDHASRGAVERPYSGFQQVFLLCAAMGVLDVVLHCFVEEPAHRRAVATKSLAERLIQPFQRRGFGLLTFAMAAWVGAQAVVGYTMALPGFFSMVHLREAFGANYLQASLVFISAALGAAFFTPWLGPWMDRAGAAKVLTRLVWLGPLSMAGWWLGAPGQAQWRGIVFPHAIVWISLAALLQGAIYTGAMLCQFRLTQVFTAPEGRTVAMAVHWSIVGLGGALGAVGAGCIKDALPSGPLGFLPGQWCAFDLLVLLHALIAWTVVWPLCRALQRGADGETSELSPP